MAKSIQSHPVQSGKGAFAVPGNSSLSTLPPDQPGPGVCFSVDELDALQLLLLHARSVAGLIRQNEDETNLNLDYLVGSAWLIQEQIDRADAVIEGALARARAKREVPHD